MRRFGCGSKTVDGTIAPLMNRQGPAGVQCGKPPRGAFFEDFSVTALFRTAPWLALVLMVAASPALAASGPPPGFALTDNADLAFTSPDGATGIEQYMKDSGDWDVK